MTEEALLLTELELKLALVSETLHRLERTRVILKEQITRLRLGTPASVVNATLQTLQASHNNVHGEHE